MRGFRLLVLLLALVPFCTPTGRADVPPPPGSQQRMFAGLITDAGFPCREVASYAPATGADADGYRNTGLDPYAVQCAGGAAYLVAIPQRRPGPPPLGPDGKPIPLPKPVVRPLTK